MRSRNTGRTFKVDKEIQLLQYLIEICKGQSKTSVKAYLSHGQIQVNGQNISAFDYNLKRGDRLEILDKGVMVKKRRGEKDTRVNIVYEDEYLIVVDKRSGLLTMSSGAPGDVTAYSLLFDYVKRMYGRDSRIFIVHRIDRETSGLIIFAKDQRTKEKMQENWNDSIISRKYAAILEGHPAEDRGTITSWLTENPKSLKVSSSPVDNGGKKAVTHYKVLESGKHFSLAEFELETGRKHQIRVHASLLGCPVTGDRRYGASDNPAGRLALHARSITFRHPATGKVLSFDTGLPNVFKSVMKEDMETPDQIVR